jgi:hypothetical protein
MRINWPAFWTVMGVATIYYLVTNPNPFSMEAVVVFSVAAVFLVVRLFIQGRSDSTAPHQSEDESPPKKPPVGIGLKFKEVAINTAFINEFVSDEDMLKYPVQRIWETYHGKGPRLPGFRYDWTIDRQQQIFLMFVKSGREEFSNRLTFVLWLSGRTIEFKLDKLGSGDLKEPILTIWKMATLPDVTGTGKNIDEIAAIIKAAISAYKVSGVRFPVQQHTAVFQF